VYPSRGFATGWASLFVLYWLSGQAQAQASAAGVSAETAVYVRTDSDRTTVVAPRLHLSAPLASASQLDVVYTTDVWSSASIDIRTAATKRVVEQRDELDVSLQYAFTDIALIGGYRYSTEHDYDSHGGSLGVAVDLAQHNTTLAATLRGSLDAVGRAGDPLFDRSTALVGGRVSLTQVIDARTFAEFIYELNSHTGYLASPYRYVRIADARATMLGACVFPSTTCERENNPSERLRHALALNLRRALSDACSAGARYRFYRDDWQLQSHTLSADIKLALGSSWLVGIEYRLYRQNGASHYRPFYALEPFPTLRTSDKELSPFTAHRVELELSYSWRVDSSAAELRAVLLAAPSYFLYDDFPFLRVIRAFESTLAMELRL
jgi:hypothetical protein